MKLITSFDPSSASSGILDTNGINTDEQLMLYNDSLTCLVLTFADGSVDILPPSWNKDFIIKTTKMDKVKWTAIFQISAQGYPISKVYGTLYEPDEHVASVNAGMQRGFTLTGGGIGTGVLIDDGNPPGHEFLEATVSGAPGSTWALFNDGNNSFLGVLVSNVVNKLIQMFATSSIPLVLGVTNTTTEMLSNLVLDGFLHLEGPIQTGSGSTSGNYVFFEAITSTNLKIAVLIELNFKNGSPAINVNLPVPFLNVANMWSTDIAGVNFKNSGTSLNLNIVTSLSSSGGTTSSISTMQANSLASITSGIDTLVLTSGNTSAHTGGMLIWGS